MRPGYGPLEILAHYAGISMPAFSHFIMNYTFPETPYIGGTTLTGIYSNLISLGMQLPRPPVFLDMVMFYDITTNVYTMMRRYIADYGFVGMHLIMAILGVFYTAFYNYVRFYAKSFWIVVFYSGLMMPLFFSMNDDRFLSVILSTKTVYQMIVIYAVCRLFVKKIPE